MRRILVPVIAALCAALLAGCGMGATIAEEGPTRTSEPTRSATPSASPTPTATTDPIVLSTAGLGPLRMGFAVPDDNALVHWDPDACPSYGEGDDGYGMWTPVGPPSGDVTFEGRAGFGIVTLGQRRNSAIDVLQVWSSEYRTPSGLHVGSTDAEVQAALPGVDARQTDTARWYTVVDGQWQITFTVADEELVGTPDGVVKQITVYPTTDGDSSWWNTDVGAFCGA